MTGSRLSDGDRRFREQFEAAKVTPDQFTHRAHLRLAYIYLAEHEVETAVGLVRGALQRFLEHHGIAATKYHETLTRAWVLAVRHFMDRTPVSELADGFIDRNPLMLDPRIMLSHYSNEVLFSRQARAGFVEPDLEPIPR